MNNDRIYVTRPSLPNLDEFLPYLQEIWNTKWLTNNAKFHEIFEKELCKFLGVPYISLFANGTLALVTALQVLRISGEVITTPFSFVASTHALWWNNIKPVFVDIEEKTCNINPDKIEAAITPMTTAILPVHVYGNPCDIDKIQKIADIYGLQIIYDAAHAFGVEINGESIFNKGKLSILSFHATKPFTTMEGGAIVCHDEKTKNRLDFAKNFGFANETTVVTPGINAKMNEMQAALGLLQLKNYESNRLKRKKIADVYRQKLKKVKGITYLEDIINVKHSYAYFPIFIDKKQYSKTRDGLYNKLKNNDIFGRRYFYPLISQFAPYRGLESSKSDNLKIATQKAEQVICLPIYPDMNLKDVNKIINIIITV